MTTRFTPLSYYGGDWDSSKGSLQADMGHLQAAFNQLAIAVEQLSSPLIGHYNNRSVAAGTTEYAAFGGFGATASPTSIDVAGMPVPRAGVLSNLYIDTGGTQPVTGSLVCTVMVNGAATPLTVALSAGSGGARVTSDTTHTASVVAGAIVSLRVQNLASSGAANLRGFSVALGPPS